MQHSVLWKARIGSPVKVASGPHFENKHVVMGVKDLHVLPDH